MDERMYTYLLSLGFNTEEKEDALGWLDDAIYEEDDSYAIYAVNWWEIEPLHDDDEDEYRLMVFARDGLSRPRENQLDRISDDPRFIEILPASLASTMYKMAGCNSYAERLQVGKRLLDELIDVKIRQYRSEHEDWREI